MSSRPPRPAGRSDRVVVAGDSSGTGKPALWTALGNAYYDREDWEKAIEAYENARRRQPKDPDLLSDLGSPLTATPASSGGPSIYFEKARENGPDHWQSLLNLTLVHAYDLGDPDKAQRYFDEFKRRYPECPSSTGSRRRSPVSAGAA